MNIFPYMPYTNTIYIGFVPILAPAQPKQMNAHLFPPPKKTTNCILAVIIQAVNSRATVTPSHTCLKNTIDSRVQKLRMAEQQIYLEISDFNFEQARKMGALLPKSALLKG